MTKRFLAIALLLAVSCTIAATQPPESFFPHHVGDRWDYLDFNTFQVISRRLTRDSIGTDGSHSLFYNDEPAPNYRIDTTLNVFLYPQLPGVNFLRYKLGADSCEPWVSGLGSTRWAWVARVDSAVMFGHPTITKVIRYAPGNPCSLGFLEEDILAAGFGLISTQRELEGPIYLMGCIIAGDTSGVLSSIETLADLPLEYTLKQNYPNPFNPTTTIEFDLPKAAAVRVRVFDVLGRECATLLEERVNAGRQRIRWDASTMPSGIYFCRMQADGAIHTIKMMLAK
jgi:hypothetical protein